MADDVDYEEARYVFILMDMVSLIKEYGFDVVMDDLKRLIAVETTPGE